MSPGGPGHFCPLRWGASSDRSTEPTVPCFFWGSPKQGPGELPDLAVISLFDSVLVRSPLEQLSWARHRIYKENVDNLERHGGKEQE